MDIQMRAVLFHGSVPHRSHRYTGRKCTVVAFSAPQLDKLSLKQFQQLDDLGFNTAGEDADATSDEDEDGHRRCTLEEATRGMPPPLSTRWGGKKRPFHDGAGLCSPFRWAPQHRSRALEDGAPQLLEALRGIVLELPDPVKAVCRMATRHATASPFSTDQLRRARAALACAIGMTPVQAEHIAVYQPFHLHLLGGL